VPGSVTLTCILLRQSFKTILTMPFKILVLLASFLAKNKNFFYESTI